MKFHDIAHLFDISFVKCVKLTFGTFLGSWRATDDTKRADSIFSTQGISALEEQEKWK
jgi:hypothetical protein